MAFFIIGASGSGKTACLEELRKLLRKYQIHDFDDIGVPDNADKQWRQQATEKWIQKIVTSGRQNHFCLLGQMVPGEILACPSVQGLSRVNLIFLDCDDRLRVQRLRNRNTYGTNQDTLNWAAWLRMHCIDPQWEQRVIKSDSWSKMQFERWDSLKSWRTLARVSAIDTSAMSVLEVCNSLVDRISQNEP